LSVSIIETVLIFGGIPAAVIAVVYGLVYAGGSRQDKRYRPGRPFDFTPVWLLSAPERQLARGAQALPAGGSRSALPAGAGGPVAAGSVVAAPVAAQWPPTDEAAQHVTGGASDRW
jgi:hypothetical protein